jgi:MFS family permease
MLVTGAAAFGQFFLLTLYLQEVLHYSAIETGVAFVAITLTIIVFSNVAQTLVTHLGVRRVLTSGLLLTASEMALLSQLPADGHYFWNVFPALVIGGAGLAMSFVPVVIAGLAGVEREEAGVASGLINTTRQIGGAVGLAAVSTIATTYAHQGTSPAALTHGFQAAFYVLTGLAILGALISGTLIRPPAAPQPVEVEAAFVPLEEAA